MYSIEKTNYGIKLTFSGFVKAEEMKQWREESEKILNSFSKPFGVLIDMRDIKPLMADAAAEIQLGQARYKEKGMSRSAVILATTIVTMQFKRIAKESGIDKWETYIDASSTPDWQKNAIDWITTADKAA